MKPKTKLQILVSSLTHKLPKLTDIQKQWAFGILAEKCFVFKLKHEAICFECGHKWKEEDNILREYTCPNCKKELKTPETKKHSRTDETYCYYITTFKGFQVVRYFHVERYYHKGYKAEYIIKDICEHWITEKGKLVIIGLLMTGGIFYARWNFNSDWSVRKDLDKYYPHAIKYPKTKCLNIIKRNGFTGNTHNLSPSYFFQIILKYPIAETLLKAKQYEMLSLYHGYHMEKINKYWKSIKVYIKHKYKIEIARDWLDHIQLLEQFNKDLCNPKYVCPSNFKQEKERYIKKMNIIREKERIEKLKERMAEANEKYLKEKKKFLNIKITNGIITIVPLKSVQDFYKEGKELNHCIFTNTYYDKRQSLILSARKGKERLETIELSLNNYQIQQCRGLNNDSSEYHEDILALIKSNIKVIKQCTKKQQLIEV